MIFFFISNFICYAKDGNLSFDLRIKARINEFWKNEIIHSIFSCIFQRNLTYLQHINLNKTRYRNIKEISKNLIKLCEILQYFTSLIALLSEDIVPRFFQTLQDISRSFRQFDCTLKN